MFVNSSGLKMQLLQTSLNYFGETFRDKQSNPQNLVFFIIGFVVIIAILIILNIFKKKMPANSINGIQTSGSGGGFNIFTSIAFHNQLASIGFNREQIKMLDFVFKQDNVTNPQHSLNSPSLLDRHFKKAYRVIERTAGTDEEAQQRLSLLFSARNLLENQTGEAASSTRQIPENASAVLGYNQESYPVKIYSTKGENLVVENPKNSLGTNIQIPRGSKVMLSFFTKSSKGFSFESRVLGNTDAAGGAVLQLLHSNKVTSLSKRRFRRRQVAVSVSFYFVNLDDSRGGKEKRLVVDKRRLTGNIMDISIGGCSIKTNVLIPSGTRLKIEAEYGRTNIALLGQVLRTNRTGIKTIMHITFLKVPRRSLNAINAMVYEYSDD